MTKKNTSSKKKLLPAAGMLALSAAMLSSATFAWFTMSREVEVTGIHMTATVPASIQLSLGKGMNTATGLNTQTIDSDSKRLTAVTAPDDDEYWSNTVDVSEYYQFGRLTPATSARGDNIFYTGDVTGVGKTLKGQKITSDGIANGGTIAATFEQADKADALGKTNDTAAVVAIGNRTANTDPLTTANDPYNNTGAYYIDIPVWFRTSINTDDVLMSVKAVFTPGSNDYTKDGGSAKGDQIYKAARVSILEGNNAGTKTNTLTQGVLRDSTSNYYRTENGANLTGSDDPYTVNATGTATWTEVTTITQYTDETKNADGAVTNGDAVVKISKATAGTTWSAAAPYTIRVWLDGEDVNCWNATAGQDFGIALTFCQKVAAQPGS